MISVVIPYFQREPGILAKALNSVLHSEGVSDVHIVVVDDQSPLSAKSELATLGFTRFPVTLIEQANAGPGGARNTGLNNLPAGTEYVAFLDSDDVWSPLHLQNALTALSAGYDVYFCDHVQLGAEVSAFQRGGKVRPVEHPTIANRTDLHKYEGDMFNQIVTGNVIGTSTVVFNYRKFSGLRFRPDLTSAGEDYLFWLDLASNGARFAFGSSPEVTYGKGVNVYAGSGWGTDGHAKRIFHELTYRKALASRYQLSPQQQAIVVTAISNLCKAFVADWLHRITHNKRIDWKLVASAVKSEPRIFMSLPLFLAQKTLDAIQRKS